MATAKPDLLNFYQLNLEMQGLYRAWSNQDDSSVNWSDIFLDYTQVKFLHQANKNLLLKLDDKQLLTLLTTNLTAMRSLANEITKEAGLDGSGFDPSSMGGESLHSTYFESVFALLK